MGRGRRKTKERWVKSKFLWSKSSALISFLPCFKVDFLELHSQMNPQSDVVPLAKHLSQKRTPNDEPWVACWTGVYKKESIAFAVKTACTVFIVVGVLRGRPWGGGGGAILSVVPVQMSTVCGGLDLQQTGRRSLSSQRPTSLSAALAVTEDTMFSLPRRL